MKKALIIVAHPDDEMIWLGGTLLSNRDKWSLTIISLCRKSDKDRAPRFRRVCGVLKAKGFMFDLEDEKLDDIPVSTIINKIRKCSKKRYDYVFTHGENGEYGHKRHIEVGKAVTEMLRKKMILCKEAYFFSYLKKGKFCYPHKNSDKFINLKDDILKQKRKIVNNVYGFNKNSFEYVCCRDTEAFKTWTLI